MTKPHAPGAVVLALVAALGIAGPAHAQAVARSRAPRPLVRADVVAARDAAVQAGVGAGVSAGTYLRVEAALAGGVTRRDGALVGGGRLDVVGRFLVDPFAQTARGPYAGAGMSVRADGGDPNAHVYVLVVLGVEGRRRGGWYPAVELGAGGGVRLGLALRRAPPTGR